MNPEEEIIRAENLRELLKQNWEHYRHIETERYWFMSVYAAVTGGLLTIVFKDVGITGAGNQIWLLLFLIVLTVIGLLLNIRWAQALGHFQGNIDLTASMLGINAYFRVPATGIWKKLKTRALFLSFYVIVLIGLAALMITALLS